MTQKNSCSGCSSALSSPPPWSQKVATERDIDSGIITVDLIAQLPSMVRHVKSGRQWTFFLKINQTLGCFLRQKSHEVGSSCLCTIFLANRMSRIPPPQQWLAQPICQDKSCAYTRKLSSLLPSTIQDSYRPGLLHSSPCFGFLASQSHSRQVLGRNCPSVKRLSHSKRRRKYWRHIDFWGEAKRMTNRKWWCWLWTIGENRRDMSEKRVILHLYIIKVSGELPLSDVQPVWKSGLRDFGWLSGRRNAPISALENPSAQAAGGSL